MDRAGRWLLCAGGVCFAWAVAGNYLALPGYLRFLERSAASASGNASGHALDVDFFLGAGKTITWMLAWNLGAICLYLAAVRSRCPPFFGRAVAIASAWMLLWSIPELPRPGAPFFLIFGSVILISIVVIGWRTAAGSTIQGATSTFFLLTAFLFFAMATWDVCGLGSAGRILHPEQVVLERSQTLLETQSVKLMLAFAIAWLMAALAALDVANRASSLKASKPPGAASGYRPEAG